MILAGEADCLNKGPDCRGKVEYRMALSGTGRSYPRCDKHWQERVDLEQTLREDYPDSPIPPAWFDPTVAGETWDEED